MSLQAEKSLITLLNPNSVGNPLATEFVMEDGRVWRAMLKMVRDSRFSGVLLASSRVLELEVTFIYGEPFLLKRKLSGTELMGDCYHTMSFPGTYKLKGRPAGEIVDEIKGRCKLRIEPLESGFMNLKAMLSALHGERFSGLVNVDERYVSIFNGEAHLAVDLGGEFATVNFNPEKFLEAHGKLAVYEYPAEICRQVIPPRPPSIESKPPVLKFENWIGY